MTEYTADELADDSDDEKRLEKAKKAAERKPGKRKKKRVEPTFHKRAARFGMALPATALAGQSGTLGGYQLARRPPTALPPTQPLLRVLGPASPAERWGISAHIAQKQRASRTPGCGILFAIQLCKLRVT